MKEQTKEIMKVHKPRNRNFGLTAAIVVAGCLAFCANAGTVTVTQMVDSVKWQLVLDTSARTAQLGVGANAPGREAERMAILEGMPRRLTVPSTFKVDNRDYSVTSVANRAFPRNRAGSLFNAIFPLDVDIALGRNIFNFSTISNILFKGISTVAVGASQTYSTVTMPDLYRESETADLSQSVVQGCDRVKSIVVGPNVKVDDVSKLENLFPAVTDAVLLVPRNSGNMTWNGSDAVDLGGTGNAVAYYGPAEAFDMQMHDTYVTFVPNTANGLSDALGWAQTFKTAFDIDSRINITNRVAMTAAVTESMLQSVTFDSPPWYITFAVRTQAQMDNVLAAVQVDVPVIIDIEGATERIVVPENREVAILAKGGGTFIRDRRGVVISFR